MIEHGSVSRIGIIGLGVRGTAHATHVDRLGHEVVGGVDVDVAARDKFEEKFDTEVFDCIDDLFALDLDAVEISTPNVYHETAAIEGFERGLDILVEKPLAHSLASAERIATTAAASTGMGMVGFNDRFRTVVEILEAHIARGTLGDITHVEVSKIRRRGMPDRGSWFTRKELAGGGVLVDVGSHALDVGLALLGHPDELEVFGVTRSTFGDRDDYADPQGWQSPRDSATGAFDVEDSASALLKIDGGASLTIDVAWAMNRETRREIIVSGTDAGARVRDDTLTIFETDTTANDHFKDCTIRDQNDPWEAVESAFLRAVATGIPPERNTIDSGLRVQRAIDAIYRSAEIGSSATMD